MTAYLMTRGTPRRLDYRFLGASPPRRWWTPLDEWTVLEDCEVLVHGGPEGAGVLVSGIPSARRDAIRTAIRYTLVVDDPEPALLSWLAAAGLDPAARAGLGLALDAEFPADWVDGALDTAPLQAEVVTRLDRALERARASIRLPVPAAAPRTPRSWVWNAGDPRAVVAFLERAAELGKGKATGWAFTSAALVSADGAGKAAAALRAPVAVLLGPEGPAEPVDLASRARRVEVAAAVPMALAEVQAAPRKAPHRPDRKAAGGKGTDRGKARAGRRTGSAPSRPTRSRRLSKPVALLLTMLVVLAMVVLAVLALVVGLF